MHSLLGSLLSVSVLATSVFAKWSATSKENIVLYWGQNSINIGTGDKAQQRLSYYCSNTNVDVILLSFMTVITGAGGQPELNFANQGNPCTIFPGTNLLNCPQIAQDIVQCQNQYSKTILLSIGGATYTEGGFSSSSEATAAADLVWATFGPQQSGSSALRPFGSAAVDGFDFDFEASVQNMVPFANRLRSLMDTDKGRTGKPWMLTAAPQCFYPDSANGEMLNGQVFFDAIFIQFYNNWCQITNFQSGAAQQNAFNFDVWDNWAKTISKNRNVRTVLGIPASPTAAGSGYVPAANLGPVISYSKKYSSFGGVMMWDASQAYGNQPFIADVKAKLRSTAREAKRAMRRGVRTSVDEP